MMPDFGGRIKANRGEIIVINHEAETITTYTGLGAPASNYSATFPSTDTRYNRAEAIDNRRVSVRLRTSELGTALEDTKAQSRFQEALKAGARVIDIDKKNTIISFPSTLNYNLYLPISPAKGKSFLSWTAPIINYFRR